MVGIVPCDDLEWASAGGTDTHWTVSPTVFVQLCERVAPETIWFGASNHVLTGSGARRCLRVGPDAGTVCPSIWSVRK